MAYSEHLADRIKRIFEDRKIAFEEKKMMGGLCFMVNDKMCAGIVRDTLMARIDPRCVSKGIKEEGMS